KIGAYHRLAYGIVWGWAVVASGRDRPTSWVVEASGVSLTLVGSLAPDFDLPCTPLPGSGRRRVRLADFRGRWLALVFYPRDFSLVCPTELIGLGARLGEFRERGCEVLGISCDPVETHEEWVDTPRSQGGLEGLGFALASDEDGTVARAY